MSFSFLPRHIFDKLTDITPEILKKIGVDALLMDFDNTIVPYTSNLPADEVLAWFQSIRDSGIFLGVVSNSKKNRVVVFCAAHDIPCVTDSKKPFQKGIGQAIRDFRLDPRRTALVGDQIFTDVLGGNCGGLISILITPIHLHNILLRLRNWIERPIIFAARGRRYRD